MQTSTLYNSALPKWEQNLRTFLGFTDVSSDRTSDVLFKHVQQVKSEFECDKKLVGQTYNGASVKEGHVTGLQAQVLSSYPLHSSHTVMLIP